MHKRSILSISDWTFPVLVTCSSDVDTVSGVCALRGSVSTVPPWVWDGDCILPTPKCFQPRFRTKTSTTHPPWKYSSSREVCIWNRWFIRRPSVPCRKGVDFSAFWKTSRFTRDEVGCASWNNCDRCEIRVCFFPSFFFFSFFFFFFLQGKGRVEPNWTSRAERSSSLVENISRLKVEKGRLERKPLRRDEDEGDGARADASSC